MILLFDSKIDGDPLIGPISLGKPQKSSSTSGTTIGGTFFSASITSMLSGNFRSDLYRIKLFECKMLLYELMHFCNFDDHMKH